MHSHSGRKGWISSMSNHGHYHVVSSHLDKEYSFFSGLCASRPCSCAHAFRTCQESPESLAEHVRLI